MTDAGVTDAGVTDADEAAGSSGRAGGLLRAVLHTLVSLLTGTAAQLALGIALGRTLGPAAKGIFSFAQYCAALGVAGGEGIRSAYAYERSRERPAGIDVPSARELFGATIALVGVASAAVVAACLAFARHDPGQPAFVYLAIAIPAILIAQVVNLLWVIDGRIEVLNVRNTLTSGAGSALASLVALLVFHVGIRGVLAIWTLGMVAASLWSLPEIGAFLGGPPRRPAIALLREQSGFAVRATLSQLTTFLARRIDVFIVVAFVSPRLFGIYSLAIASAELMFQVSNAITWATTGRVASLDLPQASDLVARVVRSLLAIQALVAIALFVAGPSLISFVYGPAFSEAGLPLRLVLPGIVCYSADNLLSFFIAARTGRPGLLLAFETLSLALCAGATAAGIARFGIAGAAAANTLTYVVSFAIKTTYFARTSGKSAADILVPRRSDLPRRLLDRFAPPPA